MPLHSSQREKKILEQVQQHGSVSIKRLAESLGVSAMTLHRDLDKLAAQGLVFKAHGAATLPKEAGSGAETCALCGKKIPERTAFIINLPNGERRKACCAHCGLMLQEQSEGTLQAMTPDFLHGHMLSANHAIYVIQSDVIICCAPSVLSFGTKQEAEKFSKGFGGRTADMKGAIDELKGMMHST